jgi:hypothetical protein
LQLLESSVKLPVNVSTLLGPCGDVCNYALCGLNILCDTEALPLLTLVSRRARGGGGGGGANRADRLRLAGRARDR